jgi:hypothetical protein
MKAMTAGTLLELCGLDLSKKAKAVRHKDPRYDAHDMLRRGWLEAYQRFQSKPVFDGLDYVVSFIADGGTRARLVGVYRVGERTTSESAPLPPGCPYAEWQNAGIHYALERVPGFEALENRLVIDWGPGTLAWHQRSLDKPVIEILPSGRTLEPFKDYLEFTLTHSELRHLVTHPEANAEWRSRLSAVAGVYLILATTTGHQYVGSAYGTEGLWGRWASYATNGHGGNALLRELVRRDDAYPAAFTYSVLQILPRTYTLAEVLERERLYKAKLGSRATGLNAN